MVKIMLMIMVMIKIRRLLLLAKHLDKYANSVSFVLDLYFQAKPIYLKSEVHVLFEKFSALL